MPYPKDHPMLFARLNFGKQELEITLTLLCLTLTQILSTIHGTYCQARLDSRRNSVHIFPASPSVEQVCSFHAPFPSAVLGGNYSPKL